MDLSALGHTLKPLIRDTYIILVPDKDDRRVKHVTLTKWEKASLSILASSGRGPSNASRQSSEMSGLFSFVTCSMNYPRRLFAKPLERWKVC